MAAGGAGRRGTGAPAAVAVPSLARAPASPRSRARPPALPEHEVCARPCCPLPPPPSSRSSGWPRRRGPQLLSLAALPADGGRGPGGGRGDHPGSTPTSSLVPSSPR